jgi:hypothetical protein
VCDENEAATVLGGAQGRREAGSGEGIVSYGAALAEVRRYGIEEREDGSGEDERGEGKRL